MKHTYKLGARLAVTTMLVVSQLAPSVVSAVTVATSSDQTATSETVQETTSTESTQQETVSEPVSTATSSEAPVVQKEVDEAPYEERVLKKETDTPAAHPVVTIEVIQKEQQVVLEGELTVANESEKTFETTLTKLLLQQKEEGATEWTEAQTIAVTDSKVLQEEAFSFDCLIEAATAKTTEYRVAVVYEIKHYEDGELITWTEQRGHAPIVLPEIEEPETESEETTSSEATKESTEDSTDTATTETSQETETSSEATIESSSTTESTTEETIELVEPETTVPVLPDSQELDPVLPYKEIFSSPKENGELSLMSRGFNGIQPFAGAEGAGNWNIGWASGTSSQLEARITNVSRNGFDYVIQWYGKTSTNSGKWDTTPKGGFGLFLSTKEKTHGSKYPEDLPAEKTEANGVYINSYFDESGSGTQSAYAYSSGSVTGLIPGQTYYVYVIVSYYQGWDYSYYESYNFENRTVSSNGNVRYYNYGHKVVTDFEELHGISTPKFTDVKETTAKLNAGSYKGDVSQNAEDGLIELKIGPYGSWFAKKEDLEHTKTRDGTYAAHNLTGLVPGTKYTGRVRLKNAKGNFIHNSNYPATSFVTKIKTNTPDVRSVTDTTANIRAHYIATRGTQDGSHPVSGDDWDIQISPDGGTTWLGPLKYGVNASETYPIKLTYMGYNFVTEDSLPYIEFNISGLTSKTKYKIKYSVKNAAGFSDYSGIREFTTNASPLRNISTPNFTLLNDNSVRMAQGTYAGDISQDNDDGIIDLKIGPNGLWSAKKSDLEHTITNTGTYSGYTLTGLVPGTKYTGRVRLKNAAGQFLSDTDYPTASFSTKIVPNKPEVPTNITDSTVDFIAHYQATKGTINGDHQLNGDDWDIQISPDGGATWLGPLKYGVNVSETYPIRLTHASSDRGPQDQLPYIKFNIAGLTSNTNYKIKYSLKNSVGYSDYSAIREFKTAPGPLTQVTAPTFRQITRNSVRVETGYYTGDISQNQTDGILRFFENTDAGVQASTPSKTFTNLWHEKVTGNGSTVGKYSALSDEVGRVVTDLEPGTVYYGQVGLKKHANSVSGAATVWSGVTKFVTQNAPSPLETPQYPDLQNTSVVLRGNYGATKGLRGAHPRNENDVDIRVCQVLPTGQTTAWQRATTTSTDGIYLDSTEGITVDSNPASGTPSIQFKLKGLSAGNTYKVRYRVKDSTGWASSNIGWSDYSGETQFGTNIPVLSAPEFDQATATATTIRMKPGTYTGDMFAGSSNHGAIATESYNNGADSSDWVQKITDLPFDASDKTYAGATITGLQPGTRYRGWLRFKGSATEWLPWLERTDEADNPVYFYTTNAIDPLTLSSMDVPTTLNGANATFTASYTAAGEDGAQVAAHPNQVKVQISTDGTNYTPVPVGGTGIHLDTDTAINTGQKRVTFTISGLAEATTYYVKYSVVNQGGESELSAAHQFETLSRVDGLYVNEGSNFDFGVVQYSENDSIHAVTTTNSEPLFIDFENLNLAQHWVLSGQLSRLRNVVDDTDQLTGCRIVIDKKIVKTSDNGATWTDVDADKFHGTTIEQGIAFVPEVSVELAKIADIPYGQGRFRMMMDPDQVQLIIPGGVGTSGASYEGEIVWSMDALP